MNAAHQADTAGSGAGGALGASAAREAATDGVATNVDDFRCVGATPLSMVDYVAVEEPDPALLGDLLARGPGSLRLRACPLRHGRTSRADLRRLAVSRRPPLVRRLQLS